MDNEVDAFLAHHGVVGMKWGKHKAKSDSSSGGSRGGSADAPKEKMSRNKKIAIGVGIGLTVAIGAAVAISVLNGKQMDLPIQNITSNASARRGREALISKAAAMSKPELDASFMPKSKAAPPAKSEKIAGKAAQNAAKQAAKQASKQVVETAVANAPARRSLGDKVKEAAINKAKDMAYERAKEQAMDKAKELVMAKAKSMLTPASKIPEQPQVVFNPKTGLYEEVPAEAAA
jgi:hypothetical protein